MGYAPTLPAAPTKDQIIQLSLIVMLSTDETEEMISSPDTLDWSNAKWAIVLSMLTQWPSYRGRGGEGDIKKVGPIEFFKKDDGSGSRLSFRNEIRAMYGWELLVTEDPGGVETGVGAIASGKWF